MSDYFDRVERQIARSVEAGAGRRRPIMLSGGLLERVVPVLSVIVVAAVGAAFIGLHGRSSGRSPTTAPPPVSVTFSVTGARGGQQSSVSRTAQILAQRLDAVFHGATVRPMGLHIVVSVPAQAYLTRVRVIALAAPGRLAIYDWEANALMSNGHEVISGLRDGTPEALTISQGDGSAAPGESGAGSLPPYAAVRQASRLQPRDIRTAPAAGSWTAYAPLTSDEFFAFSRAGSAWCTTARQSEEPGAPCYVAGPASSQAGLDAQRPAGVSPAQVRTIAIPATAAVLQSAPGGGTPPRARYFVLRQQPALDNSAIVSPHTGTDQSGNPNVTFGFTPTGAAAFRTLTAQLAQRGAQLSTLGQTLNQHFAFVIDDRVIGVPYIDFRQYPDGISGANGADISGGLTTLTAQNLATLLRCGPLPAGVSLVPSHR